jgi:uncharacterized membrane-anchored protein
MLAQPSISSLFNNQQEVISMEKQDIKPNSPLKPVANAKSTRPEESAEPFEIESGVPLPDMTHGRPTAFSKTMEKLEVGQSFVATGYAHARVRYGVNSYCKKMKKDGKIVKFRYKEQDGKVRVWRTA